MSDSFTLAEVVDEACTKILAAENDDHGVDLIRLSPQTVEWLRTTRTEELVRGSSIMFVGLPVEIDDDITPETCAIELQVEEQP